MNNNTSKELIKLLVIILIDFLYRLIILKPISMIKSYSRHPISITFLFFIMFPLYFLLQLFKFITNLSILKLQEKLMYLLFGENNNNKKQQQQQQQWTNNNEEKEEEEDDMQQWLERCSICFDSKLDLCLDFCRDQFCLDCFQKYVSEVVKSSWGLSVTKIRCPVCRIYVPQSEWTKFVPNSIVELYNKFNKPFRSFYRCCPYCETKVTPCTFVHNNIKNRESQSKYIALLLKNIFAMMNLHVTLEQRLKQVSYQQSIVRIFDKLEWRNSTLPEIHYQLVSKLLKSCQQAVNQPQQTHHIKNISKEILQLEMRPDTWRRLQFDHISFFSDANCPCCKKDFCLKCGHDDSHGDLTCKENMKRIIQLHQDKQINNEYVQTLKWKLENSRNCPSCSIMINRDEGCNKVDCTLCGFSFCWECKSTWTEVGCGYFNCSINKNKILDDENANQIESTAAGEGISSHNSGEHMQTELGVPNINVIQSRLLLNNEIN